MGNGKSCVSFQPSLDLRNKILKNPYQNISWLFLRNQILLSKQTPGENPPSPSAVPLSPHPTP